MFIKIIICLILLTTVVIKADAIDLAFQPGVPYVTDSSDNDVQKNQSVDNDSTDSSFWKGSHLNLLWRNYYLFSHNFNESESEALTTGGYIGYESGYFKKIIKFESDFYTSLKLYAPQGKGGTLNLAPNQKSIATVGKISLTLKYKSVAAILGRQALLEPYVNKFENRMIPILFSGLTITGNLFEEQLSLLASMIWSYKPRNSQKFINIVRGLGVEDRERLMFLSRIKYVVVPKIVLKFEDYYINDIINTGYISVTVSTHTIKPVTFTYERTEEYTSPEFNFDANFTDQRSVGDNLITGKYFRTFQVSALVSFLYNHFQFQLAGSITGKGSSLRISYGESPVLTFMTQAPFEHAGENAIVGRAFYELSRLGLKGVTVLVAYGYSTNAIPVDGSFFNQRVLNTFLEYHRLNGPLKELRAFLIFSNVFVKSPLHDQQPQTRVVLQIPYTLPNGKKSH
jgi:hypothetical protein